MIRVGLIDVLDRQNSDDREHLGLASIAAYLRRRDVAVDLLSFAIGECPESPPADNLPKYDLYGFSIYPNTADEVIEYAGAIKSLYPASLICVGGQLATAAATEILADCSNIDFCVLGDGEVPLLCVVQAMSSRLSLDHIPSILTRHSIAGMKEIARVELDELTWPARDYFPASAKRGNQTARINSSLGCAASCTFCSVNGYFEIELIARQDSLHRQLEVLGQTVTQPQHRKKWRARGMTDVLGEILWLNDNLGVRSFVFNDASFEDPGMIGKKRVEELCRLLEGCGRTLGFRCSVRADSFTRADMPLLNLMRSVGFTHIFVGIEAGNDSDLKVFNKRANVADNERTIELLEQNDIDLTMGFIMLNPYSTMQTVAENYRFLARHRAFIASQYIGKVHVYFGTALHRKLISDTLLTTDFSYRNPFAYAFVNQQTRQLDEFLEELRGNAFVNKQSGKMYTLSYAVSELRALFGSDHNWAVTEFRRLREQSAAVLADYFAGPLEEGDPTRARRELPNFSAAIAGICAELDSFSLKLVYNKTFRDYLLRHKRPAIAHASIHAPLALLGGLWMSELFVSSRPPGEIP